MPERVIKYFPHNILMKKIKSIAALLEECSSVLTREHWLAIINESPINIDSLKLTEEQLETIRQIINLIKQSHMPEASEKDKALIVIYKAVILIDHILPTVVANLLKDAIGLQSEYLDLSEKNIDDQQALALVQILPCTNIKNLKLRDNHINGDGAKALATCELLLSLDLGCNHISDDAIAIAFGTHKTLLELNLDESHFSIAGHDKLSANPILKKLSLNNSQVNSDALRKYALSTFFELSLNQNNFDKDSLILLAGNLSFESLKLADNNIGDEVAKKLALSKNFRRLDLRNNKITDVGAKDFITNNVLESLNLSNNLLTHTVAVGFAANRKLFVDVSLNNGISAETVKEIYEVNPTRGFNKAVIAGVTPPVPTLLSIGVFAVNQKSANPVGEPSKEDKSDSPTDKKDQHSSSAKTQELPQDLQDLLNQNKV